MNRREMGIQAVDQLKNEECGIKTIHSMILHTSHMQRILFCDFCFLLKVQMGTYCRVEVGEWVRSDEYTKGHLRHQPRETDQAVEVSYTFDHPS